MATVANRPIVYQKVQVLRWFEICPLERNLPSALSLAFVNHLKVTEQAVQLCACIAYM